MKIVVKGVESLIDKWNLDLIRDHNWCLSGSGYLCVSIGNKTQYLHIVVAERMGLDCSDQIDHIDGNPLNNKGANLRSATQSQNNANNKKQKNNTSGYKGVTWHKGGKKWQAIIGFKGKLIYLGLFYDPKDAARTYDKAALKYFGEFARLNFP